MVSFRPRLRSAPTDLFVAGAEGGATVPSNSPSAKLAEAGRKPLRQAGAGEHKCRAVLLDQLEEPWMSDGQAGPGGRRRCIGPGSAEVGHVLDRNHDLDLFLPSTGINNGDRTRKPRRRPRPRSPRMSDLVELGVGSPTARSAAATARRVPQALKRKMR